MTAAYRKRSIDSTRARSCGVPPRNGKRSFKEHFIERIRNNAMARAIQTAVRAIAFFMHFHGAYPLQGSLYQSE